MCNENKFLFNGKEYEAVPDDDVDTCSKCAFDSGTDALACVLIHRPFCSGTHRQDKQDIFWRLKSE